MRELPRCANCGGPYINGRRNICEPCYDYRKRNGHLPADHEINRRKAVFPVCKHCKSEYAVRRGLCNACAVWEERHGTPRPAHHWQVFCKDCRESLARVKGLCRNCYHWRYMHGGKRRPRYKSATTCTNCGKPDVYAKGMCVACYKYTYMTGKPRPAKLWQKRWNPQTSTQSDTPAPRCKVCGKPSTDPKWRDLAGGRCAACYTYWRKHGRKQERPAHLWQRWAPNGWCDCGAPAVTEVTLQVDHGTTKYKLCRDCYQLEVGHD